MLVHHEVTCLCNYWIASLPQCPMALRLSRLQQELQWLHSDMSTESDRNVVLGKKLDDLYSKIRSLEERNSELTQQLNESQALCGSPNSAGSPQSDATVANLKKKVKRLESDYDLVSQKYCDLNIAHEHLQAQQEKDKKQVCITQLSSIIFCGCEAKWTSFCCKIGSPSVWYQEIDLLRVTRKVPTGSSSAEPIQS